MKFIITGFPMAPSSNALYAGGRFNGKSRRWKSIEYNSFLAKANQWALANKPIINKLRQAADEASSKGLFLKVDTYFCFEKEKLWKKSGNNLKPKILDASNRIKATHDYLANIIKKDDLYFWAGHFEKVEITQGADPQVIFVIQLHEPQTYNQLLNKIGASQTPVLPIPNRVIG